MPPLLVADEGDPLPVEEWIQVSWWYEGGSADAALIVMIASSVIQGDQEKDTEIPSLH